MDTIVSTVLTGVGVTVLGFLFGKFNVSGHAKRAIIFALSVIGGVIQLAILHQLGITSDPATWFLAIMGTQGVAQGLYAALAKALKLDEDSTNPT